MSEQLALTVSALTGFSIAFAALLIVRALGLRGLRKVIARRASSPAFVFYEGLKWPSLVWCFATSLAVAVRVSELPERITSPVGRAIEIFVILSVTVAAATVLSALSRYALERVKSPLSSNGLLNGLIRSTVFISGGLMLLSHLGIAIGPLLTALGIGGLAVALAFKDTFENLFSGINLLIDRSVELGDRIKIEQNYEGRVVDIGWRTTKLLLDDDAILVIPNTRLAQGITVNRKRQPTPAASAAPPAV
jgi:small-conductance mechanosensitive channel